MPHSKHTTHKRQVPFLLILLVAVLCTSVFAAAYLYLDSGNSVENSFTAETDPGTSVTGYAVNVGNPGYSVYVRAAVVVNWQDGSGNVLAVMPVAGTDYTLTMNTTDWFEHGGFWYYKYPVTSGSTPALVTAFTASTTKEGYTLNLELVSQTIQALGTTDDPDANGNYVPAITDAWGIAVDTAGNLIDPST